MSGKFFFLSIHDTAASAPENRDVILFFSSSSIPSSTTGSATTTVYPPIKKDINPRHKMGNSNNHTKLFHESSRPTLVGVVNIIDGLTLYFNMATSSTRMLR